MAGVAGVRTQPLLGVIASIITLGYRVEVRTQPGRYSTCTKDEAQPSPEPPGLPCGGGGSVEPPPPPQMRMPCRVPGASADLAEEFPHVADQEVGCFHGGEVAAAAELGPVHHVVVAVGEGPDGGVTGEHRHRGRYR
jgi:hypothetical protein